MVPCKNIYKIYKLAAWEVQTDWKHQNIHSWDALKLVIKTVILMKIVFAVVWGLVVVHYHFGQELLGRNPQSWLLMFWSDTFVTTKNWGGNICHVLGPNAFICLLALDCTWCTWIVLDLLVQCKNHFNCSWNFLCVQIILTILRLHTGQCNPQP